MRSIRIGLAIALLAACSKSDSNDTTTSAAKTAAAETKGSGSASTAKPGTSVKPAPAPTTSDPIAAAGVEAGGVTHDKDEGPAATISKADGTVEVRRVGEADWKAAKSGDALYPGDQVRTQDKSTATITLADESVMEVAETSTVGIASRDGSADPASSAAVLAGVARFTVTPRAPGEGAFKVYTPTGVVMTKGTVYGVGVAADGEARVGVETGQVALVGVGSLDAQPVALDAGSSVTFAADGSVGAPASWSTDDWGQWRDDTDAKVSDPNAVVEAHGAALADLGASLQSAYGDMQASADEFAGFEDKAATAADANATADYQAIAPDGAATIEASFDLGGAIEALTWSYAGHAELAAEVQSRHPDEVQASWTTVEPEAEAAILWPKRFEVTSTAYLEPLRGQYYIHDPRGRANAAYVGVTVPAFYAHVDVPPPDETAVRARVRTHVWIAPEVPVQPQERPVWIAAPRPDWRASVQVHVAPPRGGVGWYVRPAGAHGTIIVGAPVKVAWKPAHIVVKPPETRDQIRAHFQLKAAIGARVKIAPPDLGAAAKARMKVVDHRTDVPAAGATAGGQVGVQVHDHRDQAAGAVNGAANAGAGAAGNVNIKVRDHRDQAAGAANAAAGAANSAAGGATIKVKDHRDDVKGAVGGGVKVKVQAPPPPKVKVDGSVKVKVKGGVHL